jgi:hypothetical protein
MDRAAVMRLQVNPCANHEHAAVVTHSSVTTIRKTKEVMNATPLHHAAPLSLTLQDRLQVAATRLQVVMVSKGRAAAVSFVCIVLVVVQVLLQLSHWRVGRISWKRAVVGRLKSSTSTAA